MRTPWELLARCQRKTMTTLSLRMHDALKQKAQQLAKEQGVSLNGFINATIAAVAQQETLTFFGDQLRNVDQDAPPQRVLKFMRKTHSGKEPDIEEIKRAMRA
jgi:antitoxin component of RelBE/YafQ-DinJ toxin-antitoxin module